MRTGNRRLRAEARATVEVPAGSDVVLGGYAFDPLDIPFLPFSPGQTGSVARGDGHTIGEGKQPCPTEDVSKSTPSVAEAS